MPPAPARTPEKEAEGSQGGEEEEQQDQEAEEPEAKAEWAMERHTIPVSIVGIWRRGRFPRGGFDGDRRALGNTRPETILKPVLFPFILYSFCLNLCLEYRIRL